jgi:hypothetical protein
MRSPSRRLLAALAAAAVLAAILVTHADAAQSPDRTDSGPGSSSSAGADSTGSPLQPSPTTEYWTPERMRSARPAPMPKPDN